MTGVRRDIAKVVADLVTHQAFLEHLCEELDADAGVAVRFICLFFCFSVFLSLPCVSVSAALHGTGVRVQRFNEEEGRKALERLRDAAKRPPLPFLSPAATTAPSVPDCAALGTPAQVTALRTLECPVSGYAAEGTHRMMGRFWQPQHYHHHNHHHNEMPGPQPNRRGSALPGRLPPYVLRCPGRLIVFVCLKGRTLRG